VPSLPAARTCQGKCFRPAGREGGDHPLGGAGSSVRLARCAASALLYANNKCTAHSSGPSYAGFAGFHHHRIPPPRLRGAGAAPLAPPYRGLGAASQRQFHPGGAASSISSRLLATCAAPRRWQWRVRAGFAQRFVWFHWRFGMPESNGSALQCLFRPRAAAMHGLGSCSLQPCIRLPAPHTSGTRPRTCRGPDACPVSGERRACDQHGSSSAASRGAPAPPQRALHAPHMRRACRGPRGARAGVAGADSCIMPVQDRCLRGSMCNGGARAGRISAPHLVLCVLY
jgi:hypothetical protein